MWCTTVGDEHDQLSQLRGDLQFSQRRLLFGMGDGAVRFVTESIDPDIFVLFMTRDGDDIIDPSSF